MQAAEGKIATAPLVQSHAQASRLFNAYRFISRLGFHVPLVTLAFVGRPILMIGVLVACYGLASSFSPPIANALTKRLGLARAMALGEIGKAVGAIGIGALVATPGLSLVSFGIIAALCQAIGGIGYTVAAIPDGMLAGTLRGLPDAPRDAAKTDARAASFMFAAFMLAGLVGAAIAQIVFALPFFLGGASSVSAAIVAIGLVGLEGPRPAATGTPSAAAATDVAPMPVAARDAVLVYGLYRGTSLSIQVGIMPMLLFVERQIPLWLFGVAFASYTFAGFLSAKFYGTLSKGRSGRAQAIAIGILSVIAFAGLALAPGLWVAIAPLPLFVAAGVVRPYCLPRLTADLTEAAAKQARIALAERAFALVSAATTLLAFGLLAAGVPLPAFLGVVGCILALATLRLAMRT